MITFIVVTLAVMVLHCETMLAIDVNKRVCFEGLSGDNSKLDDKIFIWFHMIIFLSELKISKVRCYVPLCPPFRYVRNFFYRSTVSARDTLERMGRSILSIIPLCPQWFSSFHRASKSRVYLARRYEIQGIIA